MPNADIITDLWTISVVYCSSQYWDIRFVMTN